MFGGSRLGFRVRGGGGEGGPGGVRICVSISVTTDWAVSAAHGQFRGLKLGSCLSCKVRETLPGPQITYLFKDSYKGNHIKLAVPRQEGCILIKGSWDFVSKVLSRL